MTNVQRVTRWREANQEIVKFESRIHNLANSLVRCERRICYIRKQLLDETQHFKIGLLRRQERIWLDRKADQVRKFNEACLISNERA